MIQEMFVRARALGLEPYGSNDWHSEIIGGPKDGTGGFIPKQSVVVGDPQNGWFLLGKTLLKWMMTGGTPFHDGFIPNTYDETMIFIAMNIGLIHPHVS